MSHDILRSVPTAYPLFIVDSCLGALTDQRPFRRRLAFFFLVVLYTASFRTIWTAGHDYTPKAIRTAVASLDSELAADALAAAYVPLPPTTAQQESYARILELIESRSSAFPARLFTERALTAPNARVVGVTAVVLHWKRRKGLELVIKQITRYPFIREVIVWNNRPGVELRSSDFNVSRHSASLLPAATLRIYNSPSNMHDLGKHLACSLATQSHCYFNDDDWLNIYLDSLYTKYLECCDGRSADGESAGGRIASNTMPIIHLEHRRWRFENQDLDLHASFTWLGTGAFFPRQLSSRFLQQQSSVPDAFALSRQQSMTSDMFFSLWTNEYAEQMPNDLVPIDVEGGEVGWSRGEGVDQWSVVYGNILHAVRALHTVLSSAPHLVPAVFPTTQPPPESHLRAPCANDGCLFSTSMTPFPPPEALDYESDSSTSGGLVGRIWRSAFGGRRRSNSDAASEVRFDPFNINHIHEHEARWNEVADRGQGQSRQAQLQHKTEWKWPSDDWWTRNGSWHLAVDGKGIETCWESWRAPDADDHFGLTLVAPRFVRTIKIIGSPDLAEILAWEHAREGGDESWQLFTVREDGIGGWQPRRFLTPSPKITPVAPGLIEVTLQLEPLLADTHWYRLEDQDAAAAAALGLDKGGYREGEEVAIRKIKLVSRGKKRARLRVCQWELDGWKV